VQTITSSIDFVTGSSKFGSLSTNTHQFTGSVLMSGSLTVGGASIFSNSVTTTNLYSSGNSGIGTLNAQSITNGISLTIGDSATQHQPYLAFRRNSTGGYWAGISWYDQTTRKSFIEENSDFDLRFGTSNTLRLTISSTGAATFASTVTAGGQLITSAGQTGGYVAASSGYVNETQTVSTNGTSYYLYKSTGTANGSSSTIFNITGMSTTNGTYADIYAVAQKDATGNAINTNLEVQINGQYMVGIQAGGTSATTVRNAFRVCRMDGSWIIIGTVRS
jgi:hypothetical protein